MKNLERSHHDWENFNVGIKEQYAAKFIFFVSGFGFSTWAPMIPIVKENLQIGSDIIGCSFYV